MIKKTWLLAIAIAMSALAAAQTQIQMELAAVVEFRIEGDSAQLSCTAPTAMTSEKGTEVFPPGIWRMAAPRSARFESLEAIEERNQKNRTYVRNHQAR